MGLTVVARGRDLRLAVFWHAPDEPVAALDWWARTCLVFTEYGAWTVRSSHGGGTAWPAIMVAGSGGSEYACGHPFGVEDRNLCLVYPEGVAAPATTLVPVSGRIAALRRDLRRHLPGQPLSQRAENPEVAENADAAVNADAQENADPAVNADPAENAGAAETLDAAEALQAADALDAIGWALLAAAGSPDAPAATGARDRLLAAQLRDVLDSQYTDPGLDAVAAGTALGLSRTRMIHVFRDVTGTTPHRYLVERRVAHAARLLASGDVPVADVCFASGFGSLARFQAAFRRGWGMPPTHYRAVTRTNGRRAAGTCVPLSQ